MSEQVDLSHYIPRHLDDSAKFLFWDMDVAAVSLIGMVIGVGADYPLLGLILGVAAGAAYNKLKAGKHPGMATHLLYWFTGLPEPKELPGSHIRELNG